MANELHTMPFKCERFFSSQSVRRMRWDERGVYALLLADAWMTGGKLPADIESIRKIVGIESDSVWNRIKKSVILEKFPLSPCGGFRQNPAQKEIYDEVYQICEKLSIRGKRGAEKRWSSNAQALPKHCLSIATQANAQALQRGRLSNGIQTQTQTQSQSILPLTPHGGTSEPSFSVAEASLERDTSCACAGVCESEAAESAPKRKAAKLDKFGSRVKWNPEAMDYEPIPEDIVSDWRMAFPACSIALEVNKAAHWLRSNPSKSKRNHYRFLTNWLHRVQDRGGTR